MNSSGAFLCIVPACILALSSMSSSSDSQPLALPSCKQLPVDIVGISVTSHVYYASSEMIRARKLCRSFQMSKTRNLTNSKELNSNFAL